MTLPNQNNKPFPKSTISTTLCWLLYLCCGSFLVNSFVANAGILFEQAPIKTIEYKSLEKHDGILATPQLTETNYQSTALSRAFNSEQVKVGIVALLILGLWGLAIHTRKQYQQLIQTEVDANKKDS